MIGRLADVEVTGIGTALTVDVAAGATVLPVAGTGDFPDDSGQLLLGGSLYDYVAVDDTTITLAAGLDVAYAEAVPVSPATPDASEQAVWCAWVRLDDDGKPAPAVIETPMRGWFVEGTADAGSLVEVELVGGGYRVRSRPMQEPAFDASSIDPATMPSDFDFTGPIAVDQLTEGTLSARVLVAGDGLTTRAVDATGMLTGPGQDLSQSGFYQYGAVGADGQETRRIEMPTDPALPNVFRGNAYLDDATMQRLTLLLALSLAEGAVFTLQTGVQPPPPPSVQFGHTSQQFTDDGKWGERSGWSTDGTHWFTVRQTSAGTAKVQKWDAAGTFVAESAAYEGPSGVACVVGDGFVYLLRRTSTANWVVNRLSAATLVQFSYYAWNDADGTRAPAIGWDAADATNPLLIAQSKASDNKVTIRRYPVPASGASLVQASSVTHPDNYAQNLSTLLAGSFDFGAPRFVFSSAGAVDFRAVSTTTGDFPAGDPDSWPSGINTKVGCAWDGTNFKSMTQTGVMRTYEPGAGNRWTATADATWDAGVAYHNPTAPAAETLATVFRFQMWKRARLIITGPVLPVGGTIPATQVRFYLKKGTAAHVAGDLWLQGTVTPSAGQAATLVVANAAFTGTADRTTSTFGTGVPSSLKTASGGFSVNAQSNGSVGNGTFRNSVDARVTTLAPAETDARINTLANARIAATRQVGSGTYVTATGGVITIPHTLGVVPASVGLTSRTFGQYRLSSSTSTQVSVICSDVAGVARGSGFNVIMDWQVYA